MTLTCFLKVEDFNRKHLVRFNVIISQTVTIMVNIYFAKTGSRLLALDWYNYILQLPTNIIIIIILFIIIF